jgi:hypothetical protein
VEAQHGPQQKLILPQNRHLIQALSQEGNSWKSAVSMMGSSGHFIQEVVVQGILVTHVENHLTARTGCYFT